MKAFQTTIPSKSWCAVQYKRDSHRNMSKDPRYVFNDSLFFAAHAKILLTLPAKTLKQKNVITEESAMEERAEKYLEWRKVVGKRDLPTFAQLSSIGFIFTQTFNFQANMI